MARGAAKAFAPSFGLAAARGPDGGSSGPAGGRDGLLTGMEGRGRADFLRDGLLGVAACCQRHGKFLASISSARKVKFFVPSCWICI